MARNLLAEAQYTAAAQVAPQKAALSAALQQAIADRNTAFHAAATAYKGLSGAIHRAGPQQRHIYSDAAKSAAGTDAIAKSELGSLSSSPGTDVIKAAYAHEGAVGGNILARSLASQLTKLSDTRIAAAAGRAYSVNKAASDYSAAAATNALKSQAVANQEGLLVGSNYSKLAEAQAGRDFTANQNAQQRQFEGQKLASQQAFTHHEDALSRRNSRINAGIGARAKAQTPGDKLTTAKLNYFNKHGYLAPTGSPAPKGTAPKLSASTLKGRNDIQALVDQYKGSGDYSKVAAAARKAGFHEPIILAASNLASKGYVAPREVQALAQLGVDVPKEWQGTQVKAHVRKPKGR